MKRHLWLGAALFLCCGFLLVVSARAAEAKSKPAPAKSSAKAPGHAAAEAISTITGVAISPLLGASGVGAWQYFKADEKERANLPWFAQPWFWLSGFALVGGVFVKDSLGAAAPTALKKPLDVAEAVENKISGLVAAGAVIPMMATFFTSASPDGASLATGMAVIDGASVANTLLLPFALLAYAAVWIVGHAINMLILLSPFSTVDAALKAFRTFLLGTVAVTSFANPWIGALWALIIIVVCYFLAGWAFRLTVCGSTFIWDYVTFRKSRFKPDAKENKMFLARETNKVPSRTYGRLARNEQGELVFTYRPWLVLAAKTLALPKANYAVGCGLFHNDIIRVDGEERTAVFTLPPRYNSHEEELTKIYGWGAVVDIGLLGGLKAFFAAIKELCGFGAKAAA